MENSKSKIEQVVPKIESYVLAGLPLRCSKLNYSHHFHEGNGGCLLGKDNKPTRNIDEALTIDLESYYFLDEYWYTNSAALNIGWRHYRLIKLSEADKWLKDHPLPRRPINPKMREQVYGIFGGRCAYCGRQIPIEEMQVDHIVSYMRNGGEDTLDNYYPACKVCNRVKYCLSIDQFREQVRNCARIHHKPKRQYLNADSDKIAEYYDLLGEDWKEKKIVFYFERMGCEFRDYQKGNGKSHMKEKLEEPK